MIRSSIALNVILLSFLLTACSGDKKSSGASLEDSYDYTFNGCNTGKHSFSATSKEELREKVCTALMDDTLNKSCAFSMRKDRFDKDCTGTEIEKKITSANQTTNPSENNANNGQVDGDESSNQGGSTTDPKEENAIKLFKESIAFGDQKWQPAKVDISVQKEDGKKQKAECTLATPIKLNGTFPNISFSLGSLECKSKNESINSAKLELFKLATNLSYSVRHNTYSPDETQFLLNLDRLPQYLHLPSAVEIDDFGTVGSLNASMIGNRFLFMDMVIPTRWVSFGLFNKEPISYYVEIKLSATNGKISDIKISVDLKGGDVPAKIILEGSLL